MDTAKREVFLVTHQSNILCKHLILVYNPCVLTENRTVRDPIIQFFVYMVGYYCYYFIDGLTSVIWNLHPSGLQGTMRPLWKKGEL